MRRITSNDRLTGGDLFVDQSHDGNTTPTTLTASWFNNVQEEICKAVEGFGGVVNTEVATTEANRVDYIEDYYQLRNAILRMADSACPVGSLKAFDKNDAIQNNFLAEWVKCERDDDGAHWFSEQMATACAQVIGEESSFYRLHSQNLLLKWAECDGTFPLPVPGGENVWTREEIEYATDQTIRSDSPLRSAIGALKPKFITNLNGNKNEEVFLAGSVNPGGSTTTTRHILSLTEITSRAAFSARRNYQAVVFNNAMYVIGGYGSGRKNDVWKSSNGSTWTQEDPIGRIFSPIAYHQVVVFEGAMYVIGGQVGGAYTNEVWKSTDGKNWQELTSNANFSARSNHQAVVFNNAMYVIGGWGDGGDDYKNDVWKSTDGSTWTQEEPIGEIFSPRYYHQAVVFNNAMYVIGGYRGGFTYANDVWKSTDGKNWEDVTPTNSIFSPRYSPQAVVFNNAMYVFGGWDASGHKNDVWKSTDGFTWTQVYPGNSIFSPRYSHQAVVYNGAIYVIGGRDASGDKNDVWTIQEENIPVVSNNFKAISIAELPAHTLDISHNHSSFRSSSGGSHHHGVYEVDSTDRTGSYTGFQAETRTTETGATVNTTSNGSHSHQIDVPAYSGQSSPMGGGVAFDVRPRHALVKYYMRVQ